MIRTKLLFAALVMTCGTAVAPALAQQNPGAPGTDQVIPEKDRSRPEDQPKTSGSGQTLSDKLDKTDGVLTPPSNVDPDIHKPAPNTGTMPVIPPPGSPNSSAPQVDPK